MLKEMLNEPIKVSDKEKKDLFNNYHNLIEYKRTWSYEEFLKRREKIICLFTGNRRGKTSQVAHSYVLRILGKHPVPEKNMTPDKVVRIYRFASLLLPNDPEGGEVKNTQYPFFKKFLPPHLLKRDITFRRPVMTIKDPQGGKDLYVEFVSYNQDVLAQAGVERESIWCDESSSQAFYEEQLLRLLTTGGDLIYTLTPAEQLNFEFEALFEKARVYIRTPFVIAREKERYKKTHEPIEVTDSSKSIAVLMSATDDNPILSKAEIDEMFDLLDDEDVVDIRRFGLFRSVSGLVFKEFERCHVISKDRYFPDGMPAEWKYGRVVDYHEVVPWACAFMALSPENECFIWDEYNPSPERFVTKDITRTLALKSKDYKYPLNLIDPWAAKKQSNTGRSVLDDFNNFFYELRKEGIGTGGYWQTWDSKVIAKGNDEIRTRIRNAKEVGTPFNNKGLPTLWILDNCRHVIESFKHWKKEEWASRNDSLNKEMKDGFEEKWGHFPIAIGCMLKHTGWSTRGYGGFVQKKSVYRDAFRPQIGA